MARDNNSNYNSQEVSVSEQLEPKKDENGSSQVNGKCSRKRKPNEAAGEKMSASGKTSNGFNETSSTIAVCDKSSLSSVVTGGCPSSAPPSSPDFQPEKKKESSFVVVPPVDVVRYSDPVDKEDVLIDTTQVQEIYKFFEEFRDSPKEPKRFEMTPPREVKGESGEFESQPVHRDPNVIRSSDIIDDIPKTDTAKKMLGVFKRLESQPKEPSTPNASPDIIPVEPEMARNLKAKFENWVERENNNNNESEEGGEGHEGDVKEELFKLRQRICLGRSASMRQIYENGNHAELSVPKTNGFHREAAIIASKVKAISIKEKFEKGQLERDVEEEKLKALQKEKLTDLSVVVDAETAAREAKKIFKELDAKKDENGCSSESNGKPILPSPGSRKLHKPPSVTGKQGINGLTRSSTIAAFTPSAPPSSSSAPLSSSSPDKESPPSPVVPPVDDPLIHTEVMALPKDVKADSGEFESQPVNLDPNVIRSSDVIDDIPRTDTAKKMLGVFKQLESQSKEFSTPNVSSSKQEPKPLKRMTPPRELDTPASVKKEDSVDAHVSENKLPEEPIVRSSVKTEDIIPVEPEMARSLRAKFENWANDVERENNNKNNYNGHYDLPDDFTPQLEMTKSLKAKFESIKSESNRPVERRRPRVNRFVQEMNENQNERCSICEKTLYALEKVEFSGVKMHKSCFKCSHCMSSLRLDNYTLAAGKFYCLTHFKQLFMSKGNYDEGFGREQHKEKWNPRTSSNRNPSSSTDDSAEEVDSVNGSGDHPPIPSQEDHPVVSQEEVA